MKLDNFLTKKWVKPKPNKKDWVCFWIFVIGGLWLEMMILPFFADSLPMMQIGEELPNVPPPQITYVI